MTEIEHRGVRSPDVTRLVRRPHSPWISPLRIASFAVLITAQGCVLLPRKDRPQAQPQPTQTLPSAQESPGVRTVSVDISKSNDQVLFRKEVTPDQRVKVNLDLGRVFEVRGDYEAALGHYQQSLEACRLKGVGRTRSAQEALAERRIAGALDHLGRFAQAELHYKKAIQLNPKDPKIWNDAGYSYYLQGRWADSERALTTAAKLAPEDSRIKVNLGLTLAASGRTDEALVLLSQNGGDATARANLGYLLASTGQLDLARAQYEQALALQPNLEVARHALAQLGRMTAANVASVTGPSTPSPTVSAERPDPALIRASSPATSVETLSPELRKPSVPTFRSTLPPLPSRTLPHALQSRPLGSTSRS